MAKRVLVRDCTSREQWRDWCSRFPKKGGTCWYFINKNGYYEYNQPCKGYGEFRCNRMRRYDAIHSADDSWITKAARSAFPYKGEEDLRSAFIRGAKYATRKLKNNG